MKRYGTLALLALLCHTALLGQQHVILKDIVSGSGHGTPAQCPVAERNGLAYFVGIGQNNDYRIWSTDGTPANTIAITPANTHYDIGHMATTSQRLVFNGYQGSSNGVFAYTYANQSVATILSTPGREVVLMTPLNASTVLFVTTNFLQDSTWLYSTNGTSGGTMLLGQYDMDPQQITTSYYKGRLVFSERSTEIDIFEPVITDGTVAGTKYVIDFINETVTNDLTEVTTAVASGGVLFVKAFGNIGYAFDGGAVPTGIIASGQYVSAHRVAGRNILITNYDVVVLDSVAHTHTTLSVSPGFWTDPIAFNDLLYFHDDDEMVVETDGTNAGTRVISSVSAGTTNFDPTLFGHDDAIYYSTLQSGNLNLRIVYPASGVDTMFAPVKTSGGESFPAKLFSAGTRVGYLRQVNSPGREWWSYDPNFMVGTREWLTAVAYTVFPNPVTDLLHITLEDDTWLNARAIIRDMQGRLIWSGIVHEGAAHVATSHWPAGLYSLHLHQGDQMSPAKMVLKL